MKTEETIDLATWRSLVTLTGIILVVEWDFSTWLKKVKGKSGSKEAEAVPIDNLMKKKR